MKRLLLILAILTLTSCSFDNKTGIWKDASSIPVDNKSTKSILANQPDSKYEDVFTENQTFNEEKESLNFSNIKVDETTTIVNWLEQYAIPTNNISNFSYSGNEKLLSRSSKLSNFSSVKSNLNRNIVFYKDNLISYDHKGKIFIYSLSLKKKIFEYSFYKKKFKKVNKEIYLIVNENILYAADNLGYMYALNLDEKSIIWAKNYGIPFRSNIKLAYNQILLANQDNVIYSINSNTGEKNWQFATSPTFLKSDFKNNIALDLLNDNLFFLNTSGQLYSINYLKEKINWVLNFKNTSLPGDTELFLSHPIVLKSESLITTTKNALISYNATTALRNWSLSAQTIFKPIINSNYTYAILKNNLLICIDNTTGNVMWSKNVFKSKEFEKIKKIFKLVVDFKIVNSKINIYYANGYLLSFNPINGNLVSLNKISKKGISSKIFFLKDRMLFIDNKNKLLNFN